MRARDAKPGTSLDRPAPHEEMKALLEKVNQASRLLDVATIKEAKTVLSRTDDVDNELANQVKEKLTKIGNAATGDAAFLTDFTKNMQELIEDAEEGERNLTSVSLMGYDVSLELLNEVLDVLLLLQLHNLRNDEDGDHQAEYTMLYYAALAVLCMEVGMRLCFAVCDISQPLVRIGCGIKVFALRKFKLEYEHKRIDKDIEAGDDEDQPGLPLAEMPWFFIVGPWLTAFTMIVLEPNLGQRMMDRITVLKEYRAPATVTNQTQRKFYATYNAAKASQERKEILVMLFMIEDFPELIIEILVLLVAGLNTSTLVWYLSTITTVVHMFRHLHAFYMSRKIHSKLLMNVPEYFTAKQLRELEFTVSQLKEAGFSCKQLKDECAFTGKELVESKSFSTSELLQAFKKGHQFVRSDPSAKVGQVVFAEGKVGVITDTIYGSGNFCKISYSDGSRNKDNGGDGDLRFENSFGNSILSDPVERVWSME